MKTQIWRRCLITMQSKALVPHKKSASAPQSVKKDYRLELEDFIAQHRELVWYVKDPRKLSDESIVTAVLNYGDWDHVQEMIKIMGIENAAAVFYRSSQPDKFQRTNYHPKTVNYFKLYFQKYAPGNTN